ncbi:endolytic transglycosylase MltG [Catenulispora rubra]|uniref:endolytic transglycosylase MltG n=1 Tax=Catenulispora rubra TaxID=280293 RepID=UPI001892463A|nr:endolytic transglycosylase MltG [Catenulispora rubra]
MTDQEPGGPGGFGEEVSRMLHARALRYPEHTDPVGLTRKHLKAAAHRRRAMVGATTTLALTGGAVFGIVAAYPSGNGGGGPGTGTGTGGKVGSVAAAPDYVATAACPENTKVPVDVPRGATSAQIANALVQSGVVKSAQAYLNAANRNPASGGITPGTYAICPRISGASAVSELLKKSNVSNASQIIVTPHEWGKAVIASLIDKRKWKQADFDTAIADNTIGLPAWSVDSINHQFTIEGMLEPGTYWITSSDSPRSILAQMVANRMTFLKSIGFEAKAAGLTCGTAKCTPEQVLTVASIAEAEVSDPFDGTRVAEGIYSRLEDDDYLSVDSTALFAIGHLPAGERPTAAQVRDPGNPYSTYAPHHGLPPTPISVPSDDMIKAALAPTHEGDYSWCVTAAGTNFYTKSQQAARDKACH